MQKLVNGELVDLTPEEIAARQAEEAEVAQANIDAIPEQLKEPRDNLWRSSTITLTNGAILKVNQRTRTDVSDTYDAMLAAGITEYAGWRAENGVYTMTLELFQESKVKALGIVSKAFSAFNATIDTHNQTPYTSLQDAVDAMTALFREE